MTCHSCQTWNPEEEHRCRRCGRRLRSTPAAVDRGAYIVAATARAVEPDPVPQRGAQPASAQPGAQQLLFQAPSEQRIVALDSLRTPAERESIRKRASSAARPAPVKTAKVEVSPRVRRSSAASAGHAQTRLDLFAPTEELAAPRSSIQCRAAVAPPLIRLHAALLDGLMIALAAAILLAGLRLESGALPFTKLALAAYAAAAAAIAIAYKLIWCFANCDSFGVTAARLRLVDLDGNAPSARSRFWRAAASFLSLGAAGLGVLWMVIDQDGLSWHDHISGTFPTFAGPE